MSKGSGSSKNPYLQARSATDDQRLNPALWKYRSEFIQTGSKSALQQLKFLREAYGNPMIVRGLDKLIGKMGKEVQAREIERHKRIAAENASKK